MHHMKRELKVISKNIDEYCLKSFWKIRIFRPSSMMSVPELETLDLMIRNKHENRVKQELRNWNMWEQWACFYQEEIRVYLNYD